MSSVRVLLLGILGWSLVEAQTYPYISFMNQTVLNNSYVDLSRVQTTENNRVQCITDLQTCCSGTEGFHRGDWEFPNGTRLTFQWSVQIYESRGAQRVDLRRNRGSLSGIYCCNIPTEAVHDKTNISLRETVCVGLYSGSGGKNVFL